MMNRRQRSIRAKLLTALALPTQITTGLIVGLTLAATVAVSEEATRQPSAETGLELSRKLCKACHVVDEEGSAATPVGPPSFAAIANKPGQTADLIKGSMILPHPPMPDIQLSNDEIMDIIAYLDTLRTDRTGPSLLPHKGEDKPKLPAPT